MPIRAKSNLSDKKFLRPFGPQTSAVSGGGGGGVVVKCSPPPTKSCVRHCRYLAAPAVTEVHTFLMMINTRAQDLCQNILKSPGAIFKFCQKLGIFFKKLILDITKAIARHELPLKGCSNPKKKALDLQHLVPTFSPLVN